MISRATTTMVTIAIFLAAAGLVNGQPCQPTWGLEILPPTGGLAGGIGAERVYAQAAYNDGSGPALYVGGAFGTAGPAHIPFLARWNGSEFSAVGSGVSSIVTSLCTFDDGSGPALYAGGNFFTAGGIPARCIARWNGAAWSALGSGIGNTNADVVWALEPFDDGTGPALYAAGSFAVAGGRPARNIARWNGKLWSAVDNGTDDVIYRLKSFADTNGAFLYAAGRFFSAGVIDARALARWNGKAWSAVGSGLTFPTEDGCTGMGIFDDGVGASLYVSGAFIAAGGVPTQHIARWNGSTWSAVGGGLDGVAWDLTGFDDGSGTALYAGGFFSGAGGSAASNIARWDGHAWRPIGTGVELDPSDPDIYQTVVFSLQPLNDGDGLGLFLGGHFITIDAYPFHNIAKLLYPAPDSPTIVNATGGVLTFCAPSPVVLSVTAVGTPPITYQWRKNSGNLTDGPGISGATTPQLTLTNLAPNAEGTYDCVVADALCQVTSRPAYVSVTTSTPVITQQPASQVVHAGAQVALIIAGGFGPQNTYQWRKNGAPVPPSVRVWGTDSTYLSISDARVSDAGLYDCVITNACGSTTSNPARLTVLGTVSPPGKPAGPLPANPG